MFSLNKERTSADILRTYISNTELDGCIIIITIRNFAPWTIRGGDEDWHWWTILPKYTSVH